MFNLSISALFFNVDSIFYFTNFAASHAPLYYNTTTTIFDSWKKLFLWLELFPDFSIQFCDFLCLKCKIFFYLKRIISFQNLSGLFMSSFVNANQLILFTSELWMSFSCNMIIVPIYFYYYFWGSISTDSFVKLFFFYVYHNI